MLLCEISIDETLPIINKSKLQKKGEYKEQNGRTHCNLKESGRQNNKPDHIYGPKQNLIFWYPTANNISWPFLSLYVTEEELAFTDLQHNQLMHTQIGDLLQNPKLTPYIHLNGQKLLAT